MHAWQGVRAQSHVRKYTGSDNVAAKTRALSVARERAQRRSRSEDREGANAAMRVPTEVERLAADKPEGS